MDNEPAALPFEGISLVSDPVHGYLSFVDSPAEGSGACERHLIDHPWVQRLRSIYQLQSARLVFPSAEHTRFSHSLGAMHVAGRFARHLYPSVSHRFSLPFFESLLRVSALLHDTGHGPFCHFFDEHVSKPRFGRSHEQMSQAIIRGPLRPVIEKIDRGVSGPFAPGERLSADWVAYLVGKGTGPNPVPAGFPLPVRPEAPVFRNLHSGQSRLCPERCLHVRGLSGTGGSGKDPVLHPFPKGKTGHPSFRAGGL